LEEDVASLVKEVPVALEAEATPSVEEREFVAPEDAIVDVAVSPVVKVNEVAAPFEDAAAVSGDAAEAPLEEEKTAEIATKAPEAPTKAEKRVKLKSSDDEAIKVGLATETELEYEVEDSSMKHITVFFGT
jgi:hypothetical protein